jgi:hypothetical protein
MFNRKTMLWATVAVVALGGAGHAATLASPPTYGGSPVASGGTITCRVFNAGSGAATISTREIIANSNVVITSTFDNCNKPLGAAQACQFNAPIPGNLAFTCLAAASGSNVSLRGVAEVTSTSGAILNAQEMR